MKKLLFLILGLFLISQVFGLQVKNLNVDDFNTNELLRQICDKSFNLQPNSVSTVPTTDTLGSGESVWYQNGNVRRLYFNLDDTIDYLVDSGGLSDQLALKQNVLGVMVVQDQKAQNTSGGTFTSGAWRTRDLNTEQHNNISGASLASNQITLPAGTYLIEASAPAQYVNAHQTKLYNITDSADAIIGTSEFSYQAAGSYIVTRSFVVGVITITAEKVFEIQHKCQTTAASNGLGGACNFTTEVYAVCKITKL